MTTDKLTAECAAEIAFTYPHARTNTEEVVGEWLDCGYPLDVDFWDLCNAVRKVFHLRDDGLTFQECIDDLWRI